MNKKKQVKESVAINAINKIIKSGRTITGVCYNGQPGPHKYVMISYTEPKVLIL